MADIHLFFFLIEILYLTFSTLSLSAYSDLSFIYLFLSQSLLFGYNCISAVLL